NRSKQQLWARFCRYYREFPTAELRLDVSRMDFDDAFLRDLTPRIEGALASMEALERGAIANPDENRMVGHYWLRKPELAPTPEIRAEIEQTVTAILEFTNDVHSGRIAGATGP